MMPDRVLHPPSAEFPVGADHHGSMLGRPYRQRVIGRGREPYLARGQTLVPVTPQHPADRGIDIVIQQEAHYPAAARSRDASATSAALKSGNASKIAPVS
jgi:hypothetical protein